MYKIEFHKFQTMNVTSFPSLAVQPGTRASLAECVHITQTVIWLLPDHVAMSITLDSCMHVGFKVTFRYHFAVHYGF